MIERMGAVKRSHIASIIERSCWISAREVWWIASSRRRLISSDKSAFIRPIGGDCDDTEETTHPEAAEICVDQLDNDCDSVKDNSEVCGSVPLVVDDVAGADVPGSHKTCEASTSVLPLLDIREIVAKQDATHIMFGVMLAGNPASMPCEASYSLHLGSTPDAADVVYRY